MALPTRFATLPRNLAIVIAFNVAIAAGIALARHGEFYESLVYSQCIGVLAMLSIDLPRRFFWPGKVPPQPLFFLLSAGGMAAGFVGGVTLAAAIIGRPLSDNRLMASVAIALFAGIACIWYFSNRERIARMRLDAEKIERGAAEARLKLLQAQIEPHFLFNTLANLQALIGSDPARAQKMLEHLNDYLRATLDATRRDTGTLGEEFALLRGYLEVLAIRMGSRLSFSLHLPEEIRNLSIPPMLLQPLVENAIKHGLEPKIEGGRVEVSAEARDGFVVVKVSDTGLGDGSTAGTGVGLAHVRERLAAAYGARAGLKIETNPMKGVTATVTIPQ
jgi:LytS/YehU family sensor histidine kinase